MSSQLILIVEENASTRAFLAEQLEADGYEILLADSRRHALHLLATHQPQLVLADINGQTLGLLDAVRGGEGLAGRDRPGHADDRAHLRGRTSSPGCGCSSAAGTTWSPSRSPTRSCADGSARCCAEPTSARPRGSAAPGR